MLLGAHSVILLPQLDNSTMPMRNYVDDFRQDGGVFPKQSLKAGDTTTHVTLNLTCTFCGYAWAQQNVPFGTGKKVKVRCPNCGFETATGL